MLQEVGQSALVVILLNRTYALGNIELGTLFWPCIMTDVISQSVVQLTDFYIGVYGDGRHLLCHRCCYTCYKKQRSNHNSLKVSHIYRLNSLIS